MINHNITYLIKKHLIDKVEKFIGLMQYFL